MGVAGGSWTGLGIYYSLFCTESMLESGFLKKKRQIRQECRSKQ